MNTLKHLCLCAAFSTLPGIASAAPLSVVEVAASDISCVFEPGCAALNPQIFNDLIDMPGMAGIANLRSEMFVSKPGTPAEGKTGYQYRVDMTQATAIGDIACVTDLHVNFGPVTQLRYSSGGAASDVFVASKGNVGTIGLSSVVQTGDVITFTFERPICAADASSKGHVSSAFGLTSSHPPKAIGVRVGIPGRDHVDVKAMVPTR